jgi:LytS/YehU family sensor histidine kinase
VVVSLGATVEDAVSVLGHAGRRARVKIAVDVPGTQAAVEAIDPSVLGFLVLVPVLRALERTPEDGQVRVSVRNEGARMVLHVQDGGREESEDTEVEQALAAAAVEYGVELHVRGSQLRLSFRAGQDRPEPSPRNPSSP